MIHGTRARQRSPRCPRRKHPYLLTLGGRRRGLPQHPNGSQKLVEILGILGPGCVARPAASSVLVQISCLHVGRQRTSGYGDESLFTTFAVFSLQKSKQQFHRQASRRRRREKVITDPYLHDSDRPAQVAPRSVLCSWSTGLVILSIFLSTSPSLLCFSTFSTNGGWSSGHEFDVTRHFNGFET